MAEENHAQPLAPPHVYRRSDDQEYWPRKIYSKLHYIPRRETSCSKCFVFFFTLLVFVCLAFLVFALLVFRIDYPKLKLDSVQAKVLQFSSSNNLASLNMTIGAEIKLSNDNFGTFKFRNGSISVVHENTTLGTTNIGSGFVRGRKRERINLFVQVRAQNMNISIVNDLVKMKSFAELRGEIRVVKIIRTHRTSFMNCSMNLNVTSQVIQDLQCL
ncbi:OLC1v1029887C1 [Oldenlandia corymbosa var. corymbosa]|uniref:OLC1v1029887C1 n=1 Tax=Oldenlandia corymbosa var. corymbosa TaxID=529605 RepID=A0AAV1CGM3_OLDCO|nr:OLC1v1029887C1 [Oldenlandia corymbosa var. corymbosa]